MKKVDRSIKKSIKRKIGIQEPTKMNERHKLRTSGTPPKLINVDLVSRNEIRSGIRSGVNIELNPKFSGKYVKGKYKYDSVIIITSYNRYDLLYNLLTQLYTQETEYKFKVIVVNDGSDDARYDTLINDFTNLILIKNEGNNGRQLYWKTITSGLKRAKRYPSSTILQIDDDFQLCDNFLNKLITLYYEKKVENNRILCISYHLYDKSHLSTGRWGLKYWVDGGGLYDIEFIKEIDYEIHEIPSVRWERNSTLSTGVWQQISTKITNWGCIVYKTPISYVNHLGFFESKMQDGIRDNNLMKTYKFIK